MVLIDTADLLESLHDQTARADERGRSPRRHPPHACGRPPTCSSKPYLRPIYDDPEFIVRNVWRLYGGWYDGNPANLKPAPDAALAARGGRPGRRAPTPWPRGPSSCRPTTTATCASPATWPRWPSLAAPDDPAVHAVRAEVFRRRVAAEPSLMAKGVFSWAASESEAKGSESA